MGSWWGRTAWAALALFLVAGRSEAAPRKWAVFDDWKIDCQIGVDKQEKCLAYHIDLSKDGKKVFDIAFGRLGPAGEPVVIVTVPLGISLRDGAGLKVDERPFVPLMINTCRPDGCESAAALDEATFLAVVAAKTMAIGVIPYGTKQPIGIPVPVKGLAAAINALRE